MIEANYKQKKYPTTRHTESLHNYFYFTDEASQHTHTQTQRKEKGDFPFMSSRQARPFGPYRGSKACAILPRYGPNGRACQDDAEGKSHFSFLWVCVCVVRPRP